MQKPSWLDPREYPYAGHRFETDHGRMHYLDVGRGPPVVLVHGTPTWSFLWRRLVGALSATHRVIAPDHLGFGLSDKPEGAPYRPADHAARLTALLDHLDVGDAAVVVHDFGGPIGLGYAIERAERVRSLVLFNTWMWSLAGDPRVERASQLMGSAFGRFLYRRLNLSPRVLLPALMTDRSKLTPELHRQYLGPFPRPADREAPWVLARELVASGDWYDSLWRRRDALRGKRALLLWGMRDTTFGPSFLDRWTEALPDAEVVRFAQAGHFVQEEEPEGMVEAVSGFVSG